MTRSLVLNQPSGWRLGRTTDARVADNITLPVSPTGPLGYHSADGTVAGLSTPPWLATGSLGAMYLLGTPDQAAQTGHWLFRRRWGEQQFEPLPTVGTVGTGERNLESPTTVRIALGNIFVLDTSLPGIKIFDERTLAQEATVHLPNVHGVVDVAVTETDLWVVAADGTLLRVELASGSLCRVDADEEVDYERITGLAGGVLLAVGRSRPNNDDQRSSDGASVVHWFGADGQRTIEPQNPPPSSAIEVDHRNRFRLRTSETEGTRSDEPWFNRAGRPVSISAESWAGPAAYTKRAAFETVPLDSGIAENLWQRLRIEARLPPGSAIEVFATTSEIELAQSARPSPNDDRWKRLAAATGSGSGQSVQVIDAPIPIPPGRFLLLRVELSGDGYATPEIAAIQLDFDRSSWVDLLPAVFRQDPTGRDFLERFLAIGRTSVDQVELFANNPDHVYDIDAMPPAMLRTVATWLDVILDPDLVEMSDDSEQAETLRSLLRDVAGLVGRRGTPEAFRSALSIHLSHAAGIDLDALDIPSVVEGYESRPLPLSGQRLGLDAVLTGEVSDGLGSEGLFTNHAHRFKVYLPAATVANPQQVRSLRRIIEAEKPAHTTYELCLIEAGIVVSDDLRVGLGATIGDMTVTAGARCDTQNHETNEVKARLGANAVLATGHDRILGLDPGIAEGARIT